MYSHLFTPIHTPNGQTPRTAVSPTWIDWPIAHTSDRRADTTAAATEYPAEREETHVPE